MEILLLVSVLINGILGTVLYFRLQPVVENKKEPLAVKYFEEVQELNGFFRKEKSLAIKAQLIYDGLPVGQAFTVCEHKTMEVDRAQINKTIEDLARPLMKAGIKAILPF